MTSQPRQCEIEDLLRIELRRAEAERDRLLMRGEVFRGSELRSALIRSREVLNGDTE